MILKFIKRKILQLMPSFLVIKKEYKDTFGRDLNLKNPSTFNEKIQWLKLYDRKKEYTQFVDKVLVRSFVEQTIGSEYLIPIIGVFKNFNEINFESLPNRFVIKTNNSSGGVIVCLDKNSFDIENARRTINKKLSENFYINTREYPYKHIKPRIIIEEFIGENEKNPIDYKILSFNGVPDNVMVCIERETGHPKFYFFDLEWNLLRYNKQGRDVKVNVDIPKPKNFSKMLEIAEKLSKDIPLLRIDLYNINGKIYFGEMTFYPDSGLDKNLLPEYDRLLGAKIMLPKEKIR